MGCDHCINKLLLNMDQAAFQQYARSWNERPWQEWSRFLNRLWNIKELYFNGGEHFTFHGFGDLINSLDGFNINIFSNLSELGLVEIRKLQKNNNNIIIKSSYHPLKDGEVNQYLERAREIPKGILWVPHIIRWPGVSVKMYKDAFSRWGVILTDDDHVYDRTMQERSTFKVYCRTNEHNIGPDMQMYRCLVHLLRRTNGVPIDDYSFKHWEIICHDYPWCKTSTAYNEIRGM
jgi:hypothetical protein